MIKWIRKMHIISYLPVDSFVLSVRMKHERKSVLNKVYFYGDLSTAQDDWGYI